VPGTLKPPPPPYAGSPRSIRRPTGPEKRNVPHLTPHTCRRRPGPPPRASRAKSQCTVPVAASVQPTPPCQRLVHFLGLVGSWPRHPPPVPLRTQGSSTQNWHQSLTWATGSQTSDPPSDKVPQFSVNCQRMSCTEKMSISNALRSTIRRSGRAWHMKTSLLKPIAKNN
jgi:hypothetical protein